MQLQLKKIVGRFFLLQICLPPFFRRRLIMDLKTPQYEKIQKGFPRPSFYNNKREFFFKKKISESKPVFHTLRFNISQFAKMSPRLELFLRPWRICQPQVFAFEFATSDESKYKQRYLGFIMCCWSFQFSLAGQIKSQTINALRFRTFWVQ